MIDGKIFFDTPIKNKEEAYKKTNEMKGNNDYTTCNLLDYESVFKVYGSSLIKITNQLQ